MTKLLEVQGVTKKFGGLVALNDLSFYVEEGEVLGLMGPNGSGKTTIFNTIMGDFPPDSGRILFKGEDITKLPTYHRVRMGIARTYQVPRPLKEVTIFDDVRVSTVSPSIIRCLTGKVTAHDAVIKKILEDVGLGGRFSMYPHELTMGDLRRVELAKALATNPRIVLLDEIFAGLTVAEIEEIDKLLRRKREQEGLDFVVVSHDLKALAPLVDRVVVIDFGQFIAEGPFDQIVNDEKVKEAYFG
jgi:ABC-type branched-subunit amino acid transport system ATPase component